LTIHGNLQINPGVTFSVDLGGVNGNILIEGDYVQNGGVFNLSSGAGNSTIARIQGNLIQSSGAQITESNSGQPVLEIGGTSLQIISLAGIIQNEVSFRMNNPGCHFAFSPAASLPVATDPWKNLRLLIEPAHPAGELQHYGGQFFLQFKLGGWPLEEGGAFGKSIFLISRWQEPVSSMA
jgi:hypothetical protein